MTIDISPYTFVGKRLTGSTLKLFFTDTTGKNNRVLELVNVAAFLDNNYNGTWTSFTIRAAGSYGTDMAMYLKQEEIEYFKEVDIPASQTTSFFRALAQDIIWRDVENTIIDTNY